MIARLKKHSYLYDIFIVALAIITIVILIIQSTQNLSIEQDEIINCVDTIILIIFALDYLVRIVCAKNKWLFFKKNIPDLLSIIPFAQAFQAIRILRVFRVFKFLKLSKLARLGRTARLISVSAKLNNKASEFLKTNNFIYVAYITLGSILFGTIGISFTENLSFGDALWWSIVTTTTVGYGDISPKTALGKIIAVILMIIGIGFLGMLTGTIATYFLNRTKKTDSIQCQNSNSISLDGLSDDEINHIASYVDYLKNKK